MIIQFALTAVKLLRLLLFVLSYYEARCVILHPTTVRLEIFVVNIRDEHGLILTVCNKKT